MSINRFLKIFLSLGLLWAISGIGFLIVEAHSARSPISLFSPEQAPSTIATQTVSPSPRVHLIITGDINLGRCIAKKTLASRDYTYPFQNVAETLKNADITIGSLDGSLSDISVPMPCPESMNLIGPSRMIEGLEFAGFDVITIATNHIKDCGEQGWHCDDRALEDTRQNLLDAGIHPVGSGVNLAEARAPVIIEKQGIRFAFLAMNQIESRVWASEDHPGTAPLSTDMLDSIRADIAATRDIADVVIVLPHWGVEYMFLPEAEQREWAREFIEAGATLVVGNHPHVIQPVEKFPNGIAFYSLGNFVFDQGPRERREGVAVEAVFNGSQLESWRLLPSVMNYYTLQPYWAEGYEGRDIIARAWMLEH